MQPGQPKPGPNDRAQFEDFQIPSRRAGIAMANGVERNFAIYLWGGIGDQICASPTLAWMFKNFKGCNFVLATHYPELFKHLPFERIYDLNHEQPIWEKHLKFKTISPQVGPESLPWYFYCHGIVNCVDYCTMHAFRWELTVADKPITLSSTAPAQAIQDALPQQPWVAVHAGRHWQSKTFPKDWWDGVLEALKAEGVVPILIGADADKNRGTVDVDAAGCVDMRNKLSMAESVWLLKNARMLITNDSAPLHMAASGDAWIALLATCKHPDFITHWRRPAPGAHPEWQWRQKNFTKGNMYYLNPNLPASENGIEFGELDEKLMRKWLPDPAEIIEWGRDKWK